MANEVSTGTKRSLLIGVDEYPELGERYNLSGCVNDIELMASVLIDNFGFREEHVTMLRNDEGTRERILAAMDQLVDDAGSGDIVVIHFSGHGSQMTDREGDEADGKDETIVPYDSGRSLKANRDITDDEIRERLLRLSEKTPYLTLIFDCCHSGTLSRDPFGAAERWAPPDDRPAEELPPSPVRVETTRSVSRDAGPSGWLPLGKSYVLLAGCRDEEVSFEFQTPESDQNVTHGALSYFLSQELRQATAGTTYRDVFEKASIRVTALYPRQHPQMEGARDREIFNVRDIEPTRFIPVRQRDSNHALLGAGAAHGITVDSELSVYPPGTKQITPDSPKLGSLAVTTVRAVSSDGRITEEAEPGAITAGARAFIDTWASPEMQMKLDVQADDSHEASARGLLSEIEASLLLRPVQPGEIADARAYIIAQRSSINSGDPVPQLGALDTPTWAVVGQDGRLMMPARPVSERGAARVIRENLERASRYRQALGLRNPNVDSELKGKVDFTLMRQRADGSWENAFSGDGEEYPEFEEGERIAVEVVNRHRAPIFVSLLDFGLTGSIGLLHPIEGASERLEPGRTLQIGVRHGDEIELYVPENFPYTLDPNDEMPEGGIETFKLIATTHEADFSHLVQGGMRNALARGSDRSIWQFLAAALAGIGSREARRQRVSANEEWETTERSFVLRRRAVL